MRRWASHAAQMCVTWGSNGRKMGFKRGSYGVQTRFIWGSNGFKSQLVTAAASKTSEGDPSNGPPSVYGLCTGSSYGPVRNGGDTPPSLPESIFPASFSLSRSRVGRLPSLRTAAGSPVPSVRHGAPLAFHGFHSGVISVPLVCHTVS